MAKYYTVKKRGEHVVVESQNPIAKQIFFGWGGGDRVSAQFYGNNVPGAWGANHEDRWRWTLDQDAVHEMIRNVRNHIDDRNYYAKSDVKAALEIADKLEKMEKI